MGDSIQAFLSGQQPAEKKDSLKWPTILALMGNAGDILSTQRNFRRGYGEANPFLSNDPGANAAGQMLADAGVQLAIHKLVAPHHPTLAKWLEYAAAADGAASTVWNLSRPGLKK